MQAGRLLGKLPVLVGNCHGFVGNRMLHGYSRQASFLLEEGALPQQVDKAIYDFGLPMGPFAMGDMAGLDVGWRIRKAQAATRPSNQRYSPIADKICELGRFGQKTGAGYYRYEEGNRTPVPDPAIEQLIVATSKELGIARRQIPDQEILKRCLYPLINIGAQILDEGMALRPGDIDIIYIYGYGFPAYRGGPMFWADQLGLANVLADIRAFHAEHGEHWAPAPLLERFVAEGRRLSEFNPERDARA
jgi:3-hydroxyacyl-CoA dehydrogenase